MPHLTKLKVNTRRNCQRYARNTKRKAQENSTKNKESKVEKNVENRTQEFLRASVCTCVKI